MRNWKFIFLRLLGIGALFLFLAISLITVESTGMVDWRSLRAVAFESDDWGFAGFVPSDDVWQGKKKEDLNPGKFPAVYWGSTLEDSVMVFKLCQIMDSIRGSDGFPAVFQPNYVMSSLSFEKETEGYIWKRYNWPNLPPAYSRPGLVSAVQQGIKNGHWYPEFHATWHYDPSMRLELALSTSFAQQMTQQGVVLFPESEKARELGPWRSTKELSSELSHSLQLFQTAFDRPIGSIIAPDYTWDDRIEAIWRKFNINVIQAKREQRDPSLLSGKAGRIQKLLKRKIQMIVNRRSKYLERNCRLEPVQAPDPDAVVAQCVKDTHQAWKSGQPAIVETHRVNYVHLNPEVVKIGQQSLQCYVNAICKNSDKLPLFLVDKEIAQLQDSGVSWVIRGNDLILRNATQSKRLIVASPHGVHRLFTLSPQSTQIIKL